MENENTFIKITHKTIAAIFTVMTAATLIGIIFQKAYWHIPTLFGNLIFAIIFWTEKDMDTNINDDKQ
jgi:uncharacterized membrane protein AbrB (regulator of aidB expression)